MNTCFGEFYSFDAKLSKGFTTGKRGIQLPRNSPPRPSFVLSHNPAPHHPTNGREGVFCDDTKDNFEGDCFSGGRRLLHCKLLSVSVLFRDTFSV